MNPAAGEQDGAMEAMEAMGRRLTMVDCFGRDDATFSSAPLPLNLCPSTSLRYSVVEGQTRKRGAVCV